ncbi:MAG: hypothetical protein KatS3mg032_0824 [Cyclobacteriaceae bacterium]|nr:MAG: hypothetical protein KatS3mg032_0824 [Cyclobacteriaceae bacterium]
MRTKALIRLLFLLSAIAWLAMVLSALAVSFSMRAGIHPDVPRWLPPVLLNIYLLSTYLYYKLKLERDELLSFTDLLWRVFATGLLAGIISLLLRLIDFLFGASRLTAHFLYKETGYFITVGLWAALLMINLVAWKRLILYQKTRWNYRVWMVFEYGLVGSLVFSALPVSPSENIRLLVLVIFILLAILLAANTRWVAYLSFRQKLTALLLLLLILFYHGYLFYTSNSMVYTLYQSETGVADHRYHLFLQAVFIFILVYGSFSFLVILFNLPTSSAFEKKLEEVVNFQRISQAIQTEQNEESVYKILLETSVSSVNADAAWLEMKTDNPGTALYTFGIDEAEARSLSMHLRDGRTAASAESVTDKARNLSARLKGSRFRSVIVAPVIVKEERVGTLVLVKELADGFNREMQQIAATFANQAGISIENFRLMEEVLQSERYKEELKIARRVQKSLLPQRLEQDACFEAAAFSESADEVGGDYYDTLRLSQNRVGIIIADVSGKGTSAAFHMSQMKGVFHSLADEQTSPEAFMQRANRALAHCLERSSFISAAYFVIDTRKGIIQYARAGHCPVLYYHARSNRAAYLQDEGLALGMLRQDGYAGMINQNTINYEPNDLLVLYTDGITEARNSRGEEFGFDRLSTVISEAHALPAQHIVNRVIDALYEFTGTKNINDDYTILTVKFR